MKMSKVSVAVCLLWGLTACSEQPESTEAVDEFSAEEQEVQQSLSQAVEAGELNAEELAAALSYGHIELSAIESGYDAEQLLNIVRQQLRTAHASSPEQCKVVPVGAKPCGGPERYMVYSTQTTNEDVLLQLVSVYNNKRAAENERDGMVSDCQVVPQPAVVLRDGMCRVTAGATE